MQQKMLPIQYAKRICYTFIAVIGVPVNLVAIVILSRGKCGLSTCTTRYLVAMAAADLLVVITEVILWRISWYYFPGSFLDVTPVCSVIIVLMRAATDCSVWFTVTFSFDRFVAICCQKLKTKYCTGRTAVVVLATSCILLSSKNVPHYFALEPREIVDNLPWDCITIPGYYTEPGWLGFDWFDTVLTPLLPFTVILLLNALTVRHILMASRVRKRLRHGSKRENGSDPEMVSRRKSVILLFTISGSFILLWLIYVIQFLYYSIAGINPDYYNYSLYIFQQVGFILQNLSCCTNTFIYGVTQSKFREQLKSAVKYPVTSIIQLINNRTTEHSPEAGHSVSRPGMNEAQPAQSFLTTVIFQFWCRPTKICETVLVAPVNISVALATDSIPLRVTSLRLNPAASSSDLLEQTSVRSGWLHFGACYLETARVWSPEPLTAPPHLNAVPPHAAPDSATHLLTLLLTAAALGLFKLPAGEELNYRTNGNLNNISRLLASGKYIPTSFMGRQCDNDACVCAHSLAEDEGVINIFTEAHKSMGLTLNIRKRKVQCQPAPNTQHCPAVIKIHHDFGQRGPFSITRETTANKGRFQQVQEAAG
uniref:mu-type opioid receptor-like n=1 Tax=Pristiophorus japonicus TaxID=55135 RepID=UPI00398EDE1C